MDHLLGTRVRTYRERLELSPEDLGKNTGLDASLIRAIEDGQVYPALGVLVKLARALGQRLGTFMDDQFREDPLIVRAAERTAEAAAHKGGGDIPTPYRYFPLGRGKTDRHMEPFVIEIQPQQDRAMSSHEGEEFIIVAEGTVELAYGHETYTLQAGDSMYYNSIVPHCVAAAGDAPATIYAVIFMPF